MTEFTIALAEAAIGVSAIFPSTKEFCKDYLTEEAPEIHISVTPEDIAFEREKSAREDALEGIPTCCFPDYYLETLAVYRKIAVEMLKKDTLLFHGSVIAVDGEAYLFTARSGTGKTTHTNLWLKNIPGSYVVNGDKPLLRFTENGLYACGTPWQGKENYGCNKKIPLRAICVLERDKENHIHPVTMKEVLPVLFQQTYRPSEPQAMLKTMELVGRLGNSCNLYRLGCNMENEAAFVAYNGMKPQ